MGIASIGSALVAAVALASGGAEARTDPPTLKVTAPKAALAPGTRYDVGASGYAAAFNRLALFVSVGKECAESALLEARTGTPEHLFDVPAYHSFSVATKNAYRAKAPGDRYACGYLFLHNHSDAADQLRGQRHFRVAATR
ncbi:MAG: hypothetical protein JOZ25_04910 [Actinobacteria bacterium]|nr:hypothetical protein [Actinomycetota bacterium]